MDFKLFSFKTGCLKNRVLSSILVRAKLFKGRIERDFLLLQTGVKR
jgi:hypothetical protein